MSTVSLKQPCSTLYSIMWYSEYTINSSSNVDTQCTLHCRHSGVHFLVQHEYQQLKQRISWWSYGKRPFERRCATNLQRLANLSVGFVVVFSTKTPACLYSTVACVIVESPPWLTRVPRLPGYRDMRGTQHRCTAWLWAHTESVTCFPQSSLANPESLFVPHHDASYSQLYNSSTDYNQ